MLSAPLATPVKRNTITLNSNKYVIVGGIQTEQANEFSPQLTIGPQTYDARENVSQLVLGNFTGGLGMKRGPSAEVVGRIWDSDGADTRFPNQFTLGPLVTTSATLTVGTAIDTGGFAHFYEYQGSLYVSVADRVFKNTTGDTWTQQLDRGTQQAGPLLGFWGSDGTERLYAGTGIGDTTGTNSSADGTTWAATDFAAFTIMSMCEYDRKLIVGTATDLKYSTNGTTFTQAIVFNRGVRSVIVFQNQQGDPTLFTYDAQGLIHTIDFYSQKAYPIQVGVSRITATLEPYTGRSMAVHNGSLYIANHGGAIKVNNDLSFGAVGPDLDHGLPASVGTHMGGLRTGGGVFLFAFRSRLTGESTDSLILANNGTGWHALARTTATIRGMYVTQGQSQPRLYWAEGDNGTSIVVKRINLPVTAYGNPVNDATYTYAATSYVITPWHDLNFANLTKTLLRLTVDGEALTASETVTVSYQLDNSGTDGGSWTALTAFTATNTSVSFGSGAGIAAKQVRFKIALARGATTTNTPIVRALVLDYQVRTSYRAVKSMQVSISETQALRGAPEVPTATIISELKTAFNLTTLADFQQDDDTAIKVQVVSWPYVSYDGADPQQRSGTVQLQVLEVIAS